MEPDEDLEPVDPNELPEDDPELDPPEDDPEEPEADPEPEPEPEPEPQRQSRAQARILAQRAENKRLRDEASANKAQLEALQRQMAGLTQQTTQQRQAEQLANMDPDAREKFLAEQRMQGLQQQIQQTQWQMQETMDRTAWQTRAVTDPVAKKYAARVEQRLAEMRANGQSAPRESVYYYLLGQDMATKGPKAVAGVRAAASGRVAAARGEAPRSRGDAAAGRRFAPDDDSIEALEARLGKAVF